MLTSLAFLTVVALPSHQVSVMVLIWGSLFGLNCGVGFMEGGRLLKTESPKQISDIHCFKKDSKFSLAGHNSKNWLVNTATDQIK